MIKFHKFLVGVNQGVGVRKMRNLDNQNFFYFSPVSFGEPYPDPVFSPAGKVTSKCSKIQDRGVGYESFGTAPS